MVFRKFKYFRNLEQNIEIAHNKASDVKESTEKAISELNIKFDMVMGLIKSQYQLTIKNKNESNNDSNFESEMIASIRKNKSIIIRNLMIQNIKLATRELEGLIVKKKKLCSSATFYRHLATLKKSKLRVLSKQRDSDVYED